MIDELIGKNCTGCTACQNICPRDAISMEPDREGFSYPTVHRDKCVSCGLCKTVCPLLNKPAGERMHMPVVYAAWNKEESIRIDSTSGGVFSALAAAFMKEGGYVVGAVYGDHFEIFHEVCKREEDIARLRQSKYAQSDLNAVFKEIKALLKQGASVMFCGTPCQSCGLQRFLREEYNTLFCCDFICRGVISQKVYQKYLVDITGDNRTSLTKVHFKNKDFGWNRFSTKLSYQDGRIYQKDRDEDCYMKGYLKHNVYLRPSCHECHFKELPRVSDISLGDFWGIGNYHAELDTNKGTSVILVNSKKGAKLFELAKNMLFTERRKIEEVLAGNTCLLNSPPVGQYRDYFFENFDKVPFDKLIRKIDALSEQLSVKDMFLRWLKNTKNRIFKHV